MRKTIIGILLSSAIALPAFAQGVTPAMAPRFVTVAEANMLSSNLIGLNVTNAGGQTIGEIKDVVLSADKTVAGFLVSVGGFLGMGEHYVAVDPSAISASYDESKKKWFAKMNATADELKAAPAFTYQGKWKS